MNAELCRIPSRVEVSIGSIIHWVQDELIPRPTELRIELSNETAIVLGVSGLIRLNRMLLQVSKLLGYTYYREHNTGPNQDTHPYREVFKRK